MKVAVDTYGCTRNKADAEVIKGKIKENKDLEETDISSADVVVVNTCGVKNKTQSKMINRLKRYREQGKKVLMAGCLPKINEELLEEREASMIGPNSIDKIPEAIKELSKGERSRYLEEKHSDKLDMNKVTSEDSKGIVPIAEGCLGNCSYCGVKKARGNLQSYPIEEVKREVEQLVEEGKREIYLTSQDTGCYGYDINKRLPDLLKKVTDIEGEFKVRVGMMNPEHALKIKEDLIEIYQNSKIYNFLHLPIQSGSNKVLNDMNRKYKSEEFKKLVEKFRSDVKELNLATDIIVGYPTETREDFKETKRVLEETEPDVVNISRFYPRPGTPAEKLDQLSSQELKKRSRELTEQTKKISLKKNEEYIGEKMKVLVTERDNERAIGRTHNYKKVHLPSTKEKEVEIEVVDAGPRGLKGEFINT